MGNLAVCFCEYFTPDSVEMLIETSFMGQFQLGGLEIDSFVHFLRFSKLHALLLISSCNCIYHIIMSRYPSNRIFSMSLSLICSALFSHTHIHDHQTCSINYSLVEELRSIYSQYLVSMRQSSLLGQLAIVYSSYLRISVAVARALANMQCLWLLIHDFLVLTSTGVRLVQT